MLQGFVTDQDFQAIEEAFPGIRRYYDELPDKPCTFLELVWRFACRGSNGCSDGAGGAGSSEPRRC